MEFAQKFIRCTAEDLKEGDFFTTSLRSALDGCFPFRYIDNFGFGIHCMIDGRKEILANCFLLKFERKVFVQVKEES